MHNHLIRKENESNQLQILNIIEGSITLLYNIWPSAPLQITRINILNQQRNRIFQCNVLKSVVAKIVYSPIKISACWSKGPQNTIHHLVNFIKACKLNTAHTEISVCVCVCVGRTVGAMLMPWPVNIFFYNSLSKYVMNSFDKTGHQQWYKRNCFQS